MCVIKKVTHFMVENLETEKIPKKKLKIVPCPIPQNNYTNISEINIPLFPPKQISVSI